MSAPGFVAVLRTVPVGDKVAPGETASRVLSASLTPRMVFDGGEACEKGIPSDLDGLEIASRAFLVARPKCPPRTRCPSSVVTPPQDREDCHLGGNAFVSFNGFEPVTLSNLYSQKAMKSSLLYRGFAFCSFTWGFAPRTCEVLSVGGRQCTRGCSPRGLGGVETLVQGL